VVPVKVVSRHPVVGGRPEESVDELTEKQSVDLRYAMLSVYYHAAGRQLELRGAPAVLLPLEVEPLPLGEALAKLKGFTSRPDALREAVWRVVRAFPVHTLGEAGGGYPPELGEYLPGSLSELTELRRNYRKGASLFAAALVACRDEAWDEFKALQRLTKQYVSSDADSDFSEASDLLLGHPAPAVLSGLLSEYEKPPGVSGSDDRRASIPEQLRRLETDVGLPLNDFVVEMADAAACYDFWRRAEEGATTSLPTVFPVSSIIQQDSKTLTTRSTVTTLVESEFDPMNRAIDPQSWSASSDIIQSAMYVNGPFDLTELAEPPPIGQGYRGSRFLHEHAAVSWGIGDMQQGEFSNVLNVEHTVGRDQFISLKFSLCRSEQSTFLWDRNRPGGIQLDEGFIKVRSLGSGRWRVTRQKVVRFSDRTPYVNAPGLLDLGEMLNYLAPTALSWWLESETYSLGDKPPPDGSSGAAPTVTAAVPVGRGNTRDGR